MLDRLVEQGFEGKHPGGGVWTRLVMGNSVSLAWNIPTPLLLILGKVLVGM